MRQLRSTSGYDPFDPRERENEKHAALVVALVALAIPTVAFASPGLDKTDIGAAQCRVADAGSRLVVNVTYTLVNDYDSGYAGNAWANDTIQRQLRIWHTKADTYCAQVRDTARSSPSPGQARAGCRR